MGHENHENTKNTKEAGLSRKAFDPRQLRDRTDCPLPEGVEKLASQIVDAGFAVHSKLRPGFPESVYENAMSIELNHRGISHQTQAPVTVHYRGQCVGEGRIDILVDNQIVVELKTVERFSPVHTAQVLGYLQATGLRLGLLINFHVYDLGQGIKRIIV